MRYAILIALSSFVCPGQSGVAQPGGATPLTVDLQNALERARAYNPQYLASVISANLAHEDRVQAKAAFYPTVNWLNQYIYTQGDGTPSGVFVSNDGVHVYNDQAVVHAELFSIVRNADYHRAIAAEAAARARQDIAARGVKGTVVQDYYGVIAAARHLTNAQRGVADAQRFFDITRNQEAGGEVARSDLIKAELQLQQRQRDLQDAGTNTLKAKLTLGVILFSDINQAYNVVDDLRPDAPIPSFDELRTAALGSSPELHTAEAYINQAGYATKVARGAYYPSLMIDYFYGINANQFTVHGPDDRLNLGSVVQGTVTVPVWNWGTTRSRVKQAELQKQQAENDLTFARRQLEANLDAFYIEAQAAQTQIESLHSSLDLATESLNLTTLRYQAGEATALEVADAQTTLAVARNAYDDGLARYRVALAALQILAGRL